MNKQIQGLAAKGKDMNHKDTTIEIIWTIIAFSGCFFLCELNTGFCMPGGNDIVNLGLVDFYRPVINQLPVEYGWVPLFENFDELRSVVQTCRRGNTGPNI